MFSYTQTTETSVALFLSWWDTLIMWDLKVGCVGNEVSKIRTSVNYYVMMYIIVEIRVWRTRSFVLTVVGLRFCFDKMSGEMRGAKA
jgi:hypothetical protein